MAFAAPLYRRQCLSCLFQRSHLQVDRSAFQLPLAMQTRYATTGTSANAAKYRKKNKAAGKETKKKKKGPQEYRQPNLKLAEQYTLCDAMRIIQAFEVGRPPNVPKYELHIRLRSLKDGPVIRNRVRLPYPVRTDLRICVICPADSPQGIAAREAGAALVGEEEVFEKVKAGKIDFDRCIAHDESVAKLNKAGVARILGPRQLMPSAKTNTIVKDVAAALRDMGGASEYRESRAVIRVAIGQLGFTPDKLKSNVAALIGQLKKDMAAMSEKISKDIHEVVLSSTNSPGFSLNGQFRSEKSLPMEQLVFLESDWRADTQTSISQ
ncbi:ribosomal protein L1 [Eremomyces bilateralis CBS 781.70]|uniref:Ribosomal protein L1 n=1 Tax=Eremomyces bilateralis CBS 781.70 TaxID=1392243 RepID=A0A6G1G2V0_9PEZI|nr:ribosomal protein L1 [Eremomyces bilateralis CBS 781.70]KAF1812384.1 ribosomal protein L1 [Eremomyces bilateralis CBS 781.70]